MLNRFLKKDQFIFFFCLAALAGPALSTLFDGSEKQFPDAVTYLGLANGDFDQNAVRRYRLIIPFIAKTIDVITGGLFDKLRPTHYTGEFSLRFSFFLVNVFLMAWYSTLVYKYCAAFGFKISAAVFGTIAVLTSRYTIYFSALPLIDSLICVATAMVLLGIKTNNRKLLIIAIFIGPLARESFVFIAPLIVFFSKIPLLRQALYFSISAMVFLSIRFLLDYFYPASGTHWLYAATNHVGGPQYTVHLLFSWYGLYKILVNLGLWWILPLLAYAKKPSFMKQLFAGQGACITTFLFFVLIQMLLSGSMERMFYPALMVFAVVISSSAQTLIGRPEFAARADERLSH